MTTTTLTDSWAMNAWFAKEQQRLTREWNGWFIKGSNRDEGEAINDQQCARIEEQRAKLPHRGLAHPSESPTLADVLTVIAWALASRGPDGFQPISRELGGEMS